MTTFKFVKEMPTATTSEHRLRIFSPTRRPIAVSALKIETSHGKIKVTGKLGQAHADLLDAICFCSEKKAEMEGGRIKLLVDPAAVRKVASVTSGEQFKKLVGELCAAVIEISEPRHLSCIGHLVDHIDIAQRADGTAVTKRNPLGIAKCSRFKFATYREEREMWRVELGKAFCKLLSSDIWRGYDPAPIARLRHGISQALARHVLTHQHQPSGGWKLSTLICAVSGDIDGQAKKDRRRELRADVEALAQLGVVIDGERVLKSTSLSVEQTPEVVEQTPEMVEQMPEMVEQTPEMVEQTPEFFIA